MGKIKRSTLQFKLSSINSPKNRAIYVTSSERTIFCYGDAFGKWQKHVGEIPTEKNLSRFLIGMRKAGLSVTTCNIYIRSINSFITRQKKAAIVRKPSAMENSSSWLSSLKRKQLRVFDDAEIQGILSFKPNGRNEHRIYALICTLIDTGILINDRPLPVRPPKLSQKRAKKPPSVTGYFWRKEGAGWDLRKSVYVEENGVRKRKQPYVAHLSREAFQEMKRRHRGVALDRAITEWIEEHDKP